MADKLKKYKELMTELSGTVAQGLAFDGDCVEVEVSQMISELRQMIERLRRINDGELTYEPTGKEEPTI